MRFRSNFAVGVAIFICTPILACNAKAEVPLYEVTPLGLTDTEHRRADGRVNSTRLFYNQYGVVAGESSRYSGMSGKGTSAWVYREGEQSERAGLFDAEHTRADGRQSNTPTDINIVGDVLGRATQYAGTIDGRSSWIYSNGVTTRLGFTDARHTQNGVDRESYGYQLNEAGQAIGFSLQFRNGSVAGQSGWIYSNNQVLAIGRLSASGLNSLGYSYNQPEYLNEAGQVTGFGALYSPSKVYLGNTAWLYENGVTIDIGLTNSPHVGNGGIMESRSLGISSGGDVIGRSQRYTGPYGAGQTAWVRPYSEPTKIIGLYTGEHQSGGTVNNSATHVNASGQVGGWASNYVGSYIGTSVWFYDGATTQEIGLRDAAHILSNGTRNSTIVAMNDAGIVAGVSRQRVSRSYFMEGNPDPITENGLSAFTYSEGVTKQIGLFDDMHQLSNGLSSNSPSRMNSAGQIAGHAQRFAGAAMPSIGSTGWFYDPATEITYPLEFSVSPQGRSSTAISFLSEIGACLGEYVLYEDDEISRGYRAFYWSLDHGFHDLGVLGGTGFVGWDNIYDAIVINGFGDALAIGDIQDIPDFQFQSDFDLPDNVWGSMPVLLNAPSIPEPTTLGMLGAISAISLRRRCR